MRNLISMASGRQCWCLLITLLTLNTSFGQQKIALDDLSFFQAPGSSWKIASDVKADLAKKDVLEVTKGTGILVNVPDKKNPGKDLFTRTQYGDMDLELDYLMATGSNSGIYLQGRYEVQLLDSWGSANPKSGDNGGIYERWDETKPDGKKGYEGYAPRQNVSRSPGLWQHLKISFQAPRFDANGNKFENAKMLQVELNGVIIHEDIELFGPTRGAAGAEAAVGPIRIQGDHGAVAFRNIQITSFDKQRPTLTALSYKVFDRKFTRENQIEALKPVLEGRSETLTTDVNSIENNFALQYFGTIQVQESGEYKFTLHTPGGVGQLSIGNNVVIPVHDWGGKGKVVLAAGNHAIKIFYSKFFDWAQSALTLKIAGPGIREFIANEGSIITTTAVDPILVQAPENTLLRSFMDLPDYGRVVHAVSVGSPEKIHFTYDMDNGTVVQVWRGEFLDATPMWHERGDGSSRPVGSVIHLGKPMPTVEKLSSSTISWKQDTTGTSFKTKGYRLDNNNRPVFRYEIFDALVEDAISVATNGRGFIRNISIENGTAGFYVRLAQGSKIEQLSNNLYAVDDKSYYIQLEGEDLKPIVRDADGRKEMILPIQNKLQYSILF
jgi:hypothetical protein